MCQTSSIGRPPGQSPPGRPPSPGTRVKEAECITIGGTSASSPLIAGVYGLAGNASTVPPGFEYAHASALFDVSQGNNDWFNRGRGASCGFDYLCVAKKGYDAPTGLGTPDGIGAF